MISELLHSPAPLTPGETNAALVNAQGFEFIEVRNIGKQSVDLNGAKFTQGITFDFSVVPAGSRLLAPGESGVLVSDKRAFRIRNPYVESRKIMGQFRGHLDGSGESIKLEAADGSTIKQLQYDSSAPWPQTLAGQSLVLKTPATNPHAADPTSWLVSAKPGGTPGQSGLGSDTFSGDPGKDTDGDGIPDLFEFFSGSDPENPNSASVPFAELATLQVNGSSDDYMLFHIARRQGTQSVRMTIERSANLSAWTADSSLVLADAKTNRDGTISERYRSVAPARANGSGSSFYRVKIEQ